MRQIILDTETTGFYPNEGDRLLEFAALELKDRKLTGEYRHFYIDPERNIPTEASDIHGITRETLEEKQAPRFAVVGHEIAEFLRGAEVIAHNASFDADFLDMEFSRMGLPALSDIATITDTLAMAKQRYPGQRNSLDALCNRLGVDRSKRVFHGALIDCELLAEVYLIMTRHQFDLMEDSAFEAAQPHAAPVLHVQKTPVTKAGQLKVQVASSAELEEHERYLEVLNKASKGACVWLQLSASE